MNRPVRFSLWGYLRLIRLENLIIIILTQYSVRVFLVGSVEMDIVGLLTDPKLFLLSFSTVLIAAAGYIINDYYDVKIDLINKPDRVIVGKILKRRVAIWGHLALNVLGIGIGVALYWPLALVHFMAAFALWLYSNLLKRTFLLGNLLIAALTASSILVVSIIYPDNIQIVSLYSGFAFFITLLREVVKDMEDVKGDRAFGCRTMPVVLGIWRTKVFVIWVNIVFVFSSFMALIYWSLMHLLLPLSLVVLLLVFFGHRLWRADKVKDFAMLSKLCKYIMLAGIASMIFV